MGSRTYEWPPRSDLNPLVYFWGYTKQKVYAEEPTTTENIKNHIREACRNINADVLQKMRNDFRRRLDVCIRVNDGLFEHRQ